MEAVARENVKRVNVMDDWVLCSRAEVELSMRGRKLFCERVAEVDVGSTLENGVSGARVDAQRLLVEQVRQLQVNVRVQGDVVCSRHRVYHRAWRASQLNLLSDLFGARQRRDRTSDEDETAC